MRRSDLTCLLTACDDFLMRPDPLAPSHQLRGLSALSLTYATRMQLLTLLDLIFATATATATAAGLEQLGPRLVELWLGRNRIAEVGGGLAQLRCLRRLSLQSNRLTSMAGLQHCTLLEELYLRCAAAAAAAAGGARHSLRTPPKWL